MLTLRIFDPFVFDSGRYSCTVTTVHGTCKTESNVDISEAIDNFLDILPQFIKYPLPTVALPGSLVSFCARVSPVDSEVVWSVCGRDVSVDSKGFSVSNNN